MSSNDSGRSSYLDLLVATLMEHEKNLSDIIDKMEKVTANLSMQDSDGKKEPETSVYRKKLSEQPNNKQEDIIYMRIRTQRPIRDLIEILSSLKEP